LFASATATTFGCRQSRIRPIQRLLASVLEAGTVAYSGDQCSCRYRPYPLNFSNALAHRVGSKEVSNALVVSHNTLIQLAELVMHIASQLRDHGPQVDVSSIRYSSKRVSQTRGIAGDDHLSIEC